MLHSEKQIELILGDLIFELTFLAVVCCEKILSRVTLEDWKRRDKKRKVAEFCIQLEELTKQLTYESFQEQKIGLRRDQAYFIGSLVVFYAYRRLPDIITHTQLVEISSK